MYRGENDLALANLVARDQRLPAVSGAGVRMLGEKGSPIRAKERQKVRKSAYPRFYLPWRGVEFFYPGQTPPPWVHASAVPYMVACVML